MMTIIRVFYSLIAVVSLFLCVQISANRKSNKISVCLRDLANEELTIAYSYLQLSSKVGSKNAYPGFSSLFTKLSDEDSSKGHELVKFIALRRFKFDRLINTNGIKSNVSSNIMGENIVDCLKEAERLNEVLLKKVKTCHQNAGGDSNDNVDEDANVQDYLESHLLDHHIEVNKLLIDLLNRIDPDASENKQGKTFESALITYMVDEELLHTYGDRRKDIFS